MKTYRILNGSFKGVYTTLELISLAKIGVKQLRKMGFEKVIKVEDIKNISRAIEYLSSDNYNYQILDLKSNKIIWR